MTPINKKRKLWRRSKKTTGLVHTIRAVLRKAGYDEELSVVPLLNVISVVVRKDDQIFNVRLDATTLNIVSEELLKYSIRKNNVRQVFRQQV